MPSTQLFKTYNTYIFRNTAAAGANIERGPGKFGKVRFSTKVDRNSYGWYEKRNSLVQGKN